MITYHKALCNEIKHYARTHEKQEITTIFFGGGTPSLYPPPLLTELFELLNQTFNLDNTSEITLEVNPGTVSKHRLKTWKRLGINRLSIGVQLLEENVLRSVNRHQTNQSVTNLLSPDGKFGAPNYFDNLSVDLILGLPGSTRKMWFDTLTYLVEQPISHISIYFLMVHKETPLYKHVKTKRLSLPEEALLVITYLETIKFLEKRNLLQYEISNFARPGRESLHNKAYWSRKSYRGFGLHASSFDGKKRRTNTKNLQNYIDCWSSLEQNSSTDRSHGPARQCSTQEILTPENVFLEKLMLGLRQKAGIDLQDMLYSLEKRFEKRAEQDNNLLPQQVAAFENNIAMLKKQGLLREENGRAYLTARGMVLENEVILKLL